MIGGGGELKATEEGGARAAAEGDLDHLAERQTPDAGDFFAQVGHGTGGQLGRGIDGEGELVVGRLGLSRGRS